MPKRSSVRIDRRFRGPPESGNGGYVCGLLASEIEGAASVRLRIPPPLETDLDVREAEDGLSLFNEETLVAQARSVELDVVPPAPPSFEEAERASRGFRGFESHYYPSCFVCGTKRDDGLRIFPGPLPDGDLYACPWIPDASLTSADGTIPPEILWAALDCPGGFCFPEPPDATILLGELQVELFGTVAVGERCVLTAHEVAHEGRKHHTDTALFGEDGTCRGVGRGIWIEVRR